MLGDIVQLRISISRAQDWDEWWSVVEQATGLDLTITPEKKKKYYINLMFRIFNSVKEK